MRANKFYNLKARKQNFSVRQTNTLNKQINQNSFYFK